MNETIPPVIATDEILGCPCDFAMSQERVGDTIKITVETVLPAMRWDADRQCLLIWAPPRNTAQHQKISQVT
jgi:hypothetical protein